MTKTAVVVLHYKNENDTYECIESLSKQYFVKDPFKIIVVCNNSRDDFPRRLRKDFSEIELIETNENSGFSRGNNIGIKRALDFGCSEVILLNNDTFVGEKFISKLTFFARANKDIGLVSPKIYFAKGYEYHKSRYKEKEKGRVIWYAGGLIDWANVYVHHRGVDMVDEGDFDDVLDTDFATGCCMLIKREVIEKVGLLDEKYFLYFEDVDYSVRAKNAGFRVVYCPMVALWHKNASSSGKPGSKLHIYYQTRNRLYFGFRYSSTRSKKSLLIDSLKLLIKGGVYRKAVKDYYFGRMAKAVI